MGLANIKKKDVAKGKKPKAKILKVNKYESPQMALNLIAHIMTSSADLSVEQDFEQWRDFYQGLEAKYREQSKLTDEDYHDSFIEASVDNLIKFLGYPIQLLPEKLEETNGRKTITVAVCGGYSSGKSSFLNHLLRTGGALPTSIEPTSMVNTYINCGSDFKRMSVKGRNVKDELVSLNREVLDCIQHSSASKVNVALVLNTLYVDIPVSKANKFLDGFTFIDTPGYNNSEASNTENGKTDLQTAVDAMEDADAIIWCIDTEAGTITQNDIEILSQAIGDEGNVPYVIVFTKMDKKPKDEFMGILKAADKVCKSNLKFQPVDILGYSDRAKDNTIVSLKRNQWQSPESFNSEPSKLLQPVFKLLKDNANDWNNIDAWIKDIEDTFMSELSDMQNEMEHLEGMRQEYADEKDKAFREDTEGKNDTDTILGGIKEIMLDNYDEQLDYLNALDDALAKMIKECGKALNREPLWADKVGLFSNGMDLARQADNASARYNKMLQDLSELEVPYNWPKDNRKALYDYIEERIRLSDDFLSDADAANDNYQDVVKIKKDCKNYINFLMQESAHADSIFRDCCKKAKADIQNRLQQMQDIQDEPEADIFAAIAADNTEQFLNCFSKGVDLTVCNEQGFSPLTYIARCSNNAMMKFLIDHDADLTMKDQRGYNALETAAIYHCRDICEMLIDHDKDLIDESRPLAELAENDKFERWIAKF